MGTVNEDWAIESMAGDVFLLGSATWRIRRVETGTVRVVDAAGASPSVPFWLGEAPARTTELSEAVSGLRRCVETALEDGAAGKERAIGLVDELAGVDRAVASQVVAYLGGRLHGARCPPDYRPVCDRALLRRHGRHAARRSLTSGARVNRGLGLALRKRFCRTFDFELQAAASDDAVVLSLGPQHSFPLEEVLGFLSPATVRDTLIQAVLPTPMFAARWRWNLSRSLVSPALSREPARPARHPAHGGRRPDGGSIPGACRLPGERLRADRDPRPSDSPPDPRRLLQRGDGPRGADRRARAGSIR